MIYVFDSDTLIVLFKNFYLNRFPSLWERFDQLVKEGKIISVREVYNEIEGYDDRLSWWAKNNRDFFQQPSPEEPNLHLFQQPSPELAFVVEIFKFPHFQYLISEKARLQGKPVADPLVIAKAKVLNGCVITQEADKPNAAKIPNVCKHFNIAYSDLEGFMEREDWTF